MTVYGILDEQMRRSVQGDSHVSKAAAPTTLLSVSWRSGDIANSDWSGGAGVPFSS